MELGAISGIRAHGTLAPATTLSGFQDLSPLGISGFRPQVDAYLRCTHGERSEMYRFLRQAVMARRALLLLDGLDEGGQMRDEIERQEESVAIQRPGGGLVRQCPNLL